jgi:hypothetical protein
MVEEEVKEVMPTLLPSPKWKKEQKNLKVGDVVQMCYSGNVKDNYRLAKLVEVFPDRKNLGRTVRVAYSKRDKREPKEVYRNKPLIEEKVAVQRLQLIYSSDESTAGKAAEEERNEVDVTEEGIKDLEEGANDVKVAK